MFPPLFLLILSEAVYASLVPKHLLEGRQSTSSVAHGLNISIVPAPCLPQCTDVIDFTQNCATLMGSSNSSDANLCGCSQSTEDDLVDCFNCLISFDQQVGELCQNLLDQFIDRCNTVGGYMPATTVSGGVTQETSIPKSDGSTSDDGDDTSSSSSSPAAATPPSSLPGDTGPSTGARPKGSFQKADGVLNAAPRTLFGIVLGAIMVSASSMWL